MNEERTIIWGCTPGMVIEEKYLPPPRPTQEGTYDLFIRPESRVWFDETYPEVRYELLHYEPEDAVLTFQIMHRDVAIGRRVISHEHRGAGQVTDLTGAVYPEIGELLSSSSSVQETKKKCVGRQATRCAVGN